MDLFDSISRRKSCRKYTGQPLNNGQLDAVEAAIAGFEPLYPDLPLSYRFVAETKGMFHVQAPHYLIVSGQGKEGEQENAGFLFQQLVLWFDAHDIGCVWLGKSKGLEENTAGKDIITIAFGLAEGSVHRGQAGFQRKPIEAISNAPDDPCVQAVRLAPSGMNLQPWYLEKTGDKIFIYRQILRPPVSLLYKTTKLDIGIALCHYALACRHFGKSFAFHKQNDSAPKKGYKLSGYIEV